MGWFDDLKKNLKKIKTPKALKPFWESEAWKRSIKHRNNMYKSGNFLEDILSFGAQLTHYGSDVLTPGQLEYGDPTYGGDEYYSDPGNPYSQVLTPGSKEEKKHLDKLYGHTDYIKDYGGKDATVGDVFDIYNPTEGVYQGDKGFEEGVYDILAQEYGWTTEDFKALKETPEALDYLKDYNPLHALFEGQQSIADSYNIGGQGISNRFENLMSDLLTMEGYTGLQYGDKAEKITSDLFSSLDELKSRGLSERRSQMGNITDEFSNLLDMLDEFRVS